MGIQERKEREREQRRQDIVDAVEQVVATAGLDQFTMDLVAEQAELSKGTLYLYFKTKDELLNAAAERAFDYLNARFVAAASGQQRGIDKLAILGPTFFEFYTTQPIYYAVMQQYEIRLNEFSDDTPNARACRDKGKRVLQHVIDAIILGMEDGSVRRDLDPVRTALWLWAQLSGLIHMLAVKGDAFKEEFDLDVDRLILDSYQLATRAIGV